MKHNYCLECNDIILKPMSEVDSEKYRKFRNNPEVRKWFVYSEPISEAAQKKWYLNYLDKTDEVMFSVFDRNEVFIGGCSIYEIDFAKREAEFGRIIIDKASVQTTGTGVKVVDAIKSIAKEQMNLRRLYLSVYTDNVAAIKTYMRCGFTEIFTEKNEENMRHMEVIL